MRPFALVVLVWPAASSAATLEVCATCAYDTISEAVDAAAPGDTVSIAAGTYVEHVGISKDLVLVGAGSGRTILDAGSLAVSRSYTVDVTGMTVDGGGVRVHGATASFKDIEVTHGSMNVTDGAWVTIDDSVFHDNVNTESSWSGGAFTCSGAVVEISGSTFTTNQSQYGGAIYSACDLTVVDSTFESNHADWAGSAIYVYWGAARLDGVTMTGNDHVAVYVAYYYAASLSVTGSQFDDNTDGAIEGASTGSLVVRGNLFTSNGVTSGRAVSADCVDPGGLSPCPVSADIRGNIFDGNDGAILIGGDTPADIRGNLFAHNSAPNGAAVYVKGFSGIFDMEDPGWVEIRNNVFCANEVSGDGGAVWLGHYEMMVRNNVFVENIAEVGGAIYEGPQFGVENNTFLGNRAHVEGGAIYLRTSSVFLKNDIVAFTASGYGASGNRDAASRYSNWYSNTPGDFGIPGAALDVTDITSDPRISGWSADGNCYNDSFRLAAASPAIDAGDPSYLDPDGTRSDIGAYGGPGADQDGDGYAGDEDCDDTNGGAYPGATEFCDAVDRDCNGSLGGEDADADGFRDCEDCDDVEPTVHRGADEICDGLDNDCDGAVDEDDAVDRASWYADIDEDGYGNPDRVRIGCDAPPGYASAASDCDDLDPDMNPDTDDEPGDGVDHNCDGDDEEPAGSSSRRCSCGASPGSRPSMAVLTGLFALRWRRRRAQPQPSVVSQPEAVSSISRVP